MMIKYFLIFILVFSLLYLYLSDSMDDFCHDLIEERDGKIHVYNTKSPLVPGANPIVFDHLEDYKKHMNWKKRIGSNCPVLYFKRKFTTQNKLGYQLSVDPAADEIYTLPPEHDTSKEKNNGDINYDRDLFNSELLSNNSQFPGFDPTDQEIGKKNPIDMKF